MCDGVLHCFWCVVNVFLVSLFFFLFSFISLIADGPHHYHPACGHKGSSHLSPVHALQLFYRDASSALLQLVNQWLNFTYSRSHAFRYERKNTNPTLVRIELTTSVLADVQLTYMVINVVSVQYNDGGLLPDIIILLTQCYFHRGARLKKV